MKEQGSSVATAEPSLGDLIDANYQEIIQSLAPTAAAELTLSDSAVKLLLREYTGAADNLKMNWPEWFAANMPRVCVGIRMPPDILPVLAYRSHKYLVKRLKSYVMLAGLLYARDELLKASDIYNITEFPITIQQLLFNSWLYKYCMRTAQLYCRKVLWQLQIVKLNIEFYWT